MRFKGRKVYVRPSVRGFSLWPADSKAETWQKGLVEESFLIYDGQEAEKREKSLRRDVHPLCLHVCLHVSNDLLPPTWPHTLTAHLVNELTES